MMNLFNRLMPLILVDLLKKTNYDSKINEIKSEIPSITGLATTTVLNDVIQSRKRDYDVKIKDIESKCFTKSDYNKFINEVRDDLMQR